MAKLVERVDAWVRGLSTQQLAQPHRNSDEIDTLRDFVLRYTKF
jgi:hypothetical protein